MKVLNNGRFAIPCPDDYDLTRTIGPAAFSGVYFLANSSGATGLSLLENTTQQIREIPNDGLGLELFKFCCKDKKLSREAACYLDRIDVLFNYVGHQSNSMSLFSSHIQYTDNTRYRESLRGDVIEITACTKTRGLIVNWEYSKNLYSRKTIESLARCFESQLAKIRQDVAAR